MDKLPDICLQRIFTYVYFNKKERIGTRINVDFSNNINNNNNNNNNYKNNNYYRIDSWKSTLLTCKHWCFLSQNLLKQLDPKKVLKTLFNSSLYSCGGDLPSSTKIALRSDTGKIEFPPNRENYEAQLTQMEKLVGQCKSASFGRGAKEVLDPDYRSALVLTPDHFTTNFHPVDFNILSKGGFFKLHKDTPHGPDHLGSLVVVLAFPHEGGKLVVKQSKDEQSLDASWKMEEKPTHQIKWMAFYSNCDHWIEPVTSGYRVTLTYHLFKSSIVDVPFCIYHDPIYLMLRSMIQSNSMSDEKYGFFLKNEYSTSELKQAMKNPAMVLKASDGRLYLASVALGLSTKFRAVFEDHFDYEGRGRCYISKQIPDEAPLPKVDCHNKYQYMETTFDAKRVDKSILFLTGFPDTLRKLAGSASVSTGNEPSTEGFYYQAVIVISQNDPVSKESRREKKKERELRRKRRRDYYYDSDSYGEEDDEY